MRIITLMLFLLLAVALTYATAENGSHENAKIEKLIKKLESGDYKEELAKLQETANIFGHNSYYPSEERMMARRNAAASLVKIGKPAVPSLVHLFKKQLKEENFEVLYSVTEALGNIGDETVVPTLVDALRNGKKYHSSIIMDALVKIGKPGVGALRALIADNNINNDIRLDYIFYLFAAHPGTIDETAVPVLLKKIRHTDNEQSEGQINIILDHFG